MDCCFPVSVKPAVQNTYKPFIRSRKCPGHIPMRESFAIFIYLFMPIQSRPFFTSRTPGKDQKIEQLLYFLLVQYPEISMSSVVNDFVHAISKHSKKVPRTNNMFLFPWMDSYDSISIGIKALLN